MHTTDRPMLLDIALHEDLGNGDLTTDALLQGTETARAEIRMRQPAIVSGLGVACAVFQAVDPTLDCVAVVEDGDAVIPGTVLLRLAGQTGSLLKAERLALNFLQHLCGVATLTYQFVGAVSGLRTQIAHTRKTLPGLRALEIQAVLDGGGMAHRHSLGSAVLIKDNHLQAVGSLTAAVSRIREALGAEIPIEVECDTPDQVDEALACGVDRILLDNMAIPMLKAMVSRVNRRAVLEASGGVTLRNVRQIAETGVDIISTSQITLSAPAADIGLDFVSG